jgi:hypothetical protein
VSYIFSALSNTGSCSNSFTFTCASIDTLGNGPRTYGNLRRFPYLNEDISIIKRTPVKDRVSVELRADFLNLFNRTVFGLETGGTRMVRH